MSYTYEYNDLNQRTRMTLEGGEYWSYGYDSLGQVISAGKFQSNDTAWPGYEYGYAFDDIGNRESATRNGEVFDYTPNLLNQYTERTVPGFAEIRGQADSSAVVTVNTESVTRLSDYFFKKLALDNSEDSLWEEITVRGVVAEAGHDDTDAIAEEYLGKWLPETPEAFQYDDDGNLTQDGRWDYTWNGENRLVAMETRAVAYNAGAPRVLLEFVYDSQGRRVQKTVSEWDTGESDFVEVDRRHYLYDGWNLLVELRAEDGAEEAVLDRRYAWGMDLSGSLQGAGGVGGLLMVILPDGTVLYPAYDGNGNVMGLFSPDEDEWVAEYEYGAFGEPLKAVGLHAEANPFRFSTKYTDDETGLVYYGFRYYVPETGRWPNRDPIEEQGGLNLYAMAGNNPIGGIDLLGLKEVTIWASAFIQPSEILFPYPPVAVLARWKGDGRGFGPDQSARVWHKVVIETDPSKKSDPVISNTSGVGSTSVTYYDFNGIRRTDTATASSPARATVTRDSSDPCLVNVKISASSSNPLVPRSPTIDYQYELTFNETTGKVLYRGSHDLFPWHELYIDSNGVVRASPSGPSRTPADLGFRSVSIRSRIIDF